MNHETLSEKTATPQAEQEPSPSDQKIAALTAVYDAVRRRAYENSEYNNHDINEATIYWATSLRVKRTSVLGYRLRICR